MTSTEFRAALAALGMSQARLARTLGIDKVTTHRWANDVVPAPKAVELLLIIWQAHPELIPEG